MSFFINKTEKYHREQMKSLGWELTVCNSLESEQSPARGIILNKATYGRLLFDYLFTYIPKKYRGSILEIGGGYGYLMRDFLSLEPDARALMIDISPVMLQQQTKTLEKSNVQFIESDFFDLDAPLLKQFDLVVMNEIVGDFPTACGLTREVIDSSNTSDHTDLEKIREYFKNGLFQIPNSVPFNVNIGAIKAVEKLCSLKIPFIFVSEHSCQAEVNDHMKPFLKITASNNPVEIKLMGHSEYTIRFSDLESVARHFGYEIIRGNYTDFIKFQFSNKIRYVLTSNSQKDEHEIIRQFIDDLYTYEYLLLIRS